ncbi:MAG: hypothetical protein Q6351_004465 [Candidatus Njordarchaeum guaymaensis]
MLTFLPLLSTQTARSKYYIHELKIKLYLVTKNGLKFGLKQKDLADMISRAIADYR